MLKGRNIHERHLEVAKSLTDRMIARPQVEGVVFLGGLVRGFADQYSDIDMAVITSRDDARLKRSLEEIARSVCAEAGVGMDVEVHSLRGFSRLERTECRRRDYSESRIVFDRNGEVRRLISGIVTVPDDYWIDRIVRSWMFLQWYGCPSRGNKSIAEIWAERGDAVSAHQCMNYSIELLMDLLFAINHEFVPAPKWKLYAVKDLEWRPRGLRTAMEQTLILRSLDEADLRRRVDALSRLNGQLQRKSSEITGLSPDGFVSHFLKTVVFEE